MTRCPHCQTYCYGDCQANGGQRNQWVSRRRQAVASKPAGRLVTYRGRTEYEARLRERLAETEARLPTLTNDSAIRITEAEIRDMRAALSA